jgi:hypothetical protein
MRALLCLGLMAPLVLAQGEKQVENQDQKPRPLWNGIDFAGWHAQRHFDPQKLAALTPVEAAKLRSEDEASARLHWRIDGGELINDGEGAYLTTDVQFGDAEFACEYRTVAKADSGIYLRGCPQVQIWDCTEAGGKFHLGADRGSGGLWNNEVEPRFPLVKADRPFGEWNALKIRQLGARTWVWLNEQCVVDGAVMENYWNRKLPLPAKGRLSLQTHGGEIRFRNLTVREIGPSEANERLLAHEGAGFEPVFDGKTMDGWQGDIDSYEVVDGSLCCRPGQSGNLYSADSYEDFAVRLLFRLPAGGNNGLAIRYPGIGDPAYTGLEVQILDDTAPQYAGLQPWQFHGSVYGMAAAHKGYLRPIGEWNYQEVRVVGRRVRVELNGTPILDADLTDLVSKLGEKHKGYDRIEGRLGFAGHGDPVAFRAVAIKRL